MNVLDTGLMHFLKAEREGIYHAKLIELREVVQGWLSYIPNTFPHYTRHTIEHSEAIISQVSRLLFRGANQSQPVVKLSAVEGFILAAAAYLHDAGMVCSDEEKLRILRDPEWKDWVTHGGGAKRWSLLQQLEKQTAQGSPDKRFAANLQVRHLISEFVRARHHLRSRSLIETTSGALARVDFDDPMLRRTIADVCVGHGFVSAQLLDEEQFPQERDIRGERTSVRFLATLFRLGDLLDMDCDRACPLLLSAASPLPAESLAHWTQYRCITHRATTPERIEITAECGSSDEHRILKDWCKWIVDEVTFASSAMAHARRHKGWKPPLALMEGPDPTIKIKPARDATYVPINWRFELDAETVFERLVHDLYRSEFVFVRELLQNAIDASRAAMCLELVASGKDVPPYLGDVDDTIRSKFSVHVGFNSKSIRNEMSGEYEERLSVYVDDNGIGMDRSIIERFFLQIGKSYYSSPEFKRQYGFLPSSRFGIGFLSVFSVSDLVVVDTWKPQVGTSEGPIRLTLHGPRSYVLVEQGARATRGTRVEVILRNHLDAKDFIRAVREWFLMVEVPIVVEDKGQEVGIIRADESANWTREVPDVRHPGAKLIVRDLEVKEELVRGNVYLIEHEGDEGVRWDLGGWSKHTYPSEYPHATRIELPASAICYNGVLLGPGIDISAGHFSARVDYRSESVVPTLARDDMRSGLLFGRERNLPDITRTLGRAIERHLNESEYAKRKSWQYKQALAREFPIIEFWEGVDKTVRVFERGAEKLVSLNELLARRTFKVACRRVARATSIEDAILNVREATEGDSELYLLGSDVHILAPKFRWRLFVGCSPTEIIIKDIYADVTWAREKNLNDITRQSARWITPCFVGFGGRGAHLVGMNLHRIDDSFRDPMVLNVSHEFSRWYQAVLRAAEKKEQGITFDHVKQVGSLLETPVRLGGFRVEHLNRYLERWRGAMPVVDGINPPQLDKSEFTHFLEYS